MGALNAGMVPLRREAVIVSVLLVVGLACGLYFGKVLAGEPHSAPTDYAVLVARLYESDQDKSAAISRLNSGGFEKPAEAVSAIASSYPGGTPEQIKDGESLRKLSQALGGAASATSSGGGIPTSYVLVGLVGAVALGLVVLLAVRILGVKTPSLPTGDALGRASQALRRPRAYAAGSAPAVTWSSPRSSGAAPQAQANGHVDASPVGDRSDEYAASKPAPPITTQNGASVRTRPMQPGEAAVGSQRRRTAGHAVPPIPARPGQLRGEAQRTYSFRSSYRLGDEPYDEIHPISDEGGRSLVGACGVSAARFLTEHGQKRYWGFTAWLHDYANDGQFRAVGLVSRWANDHFADEIDDWRGEGDIDEVRLVEFDDQIEIETNHLSAVLSIEDVDYVQGGPPEAVFNRLAAQFDVQVLRAGEASGNDALPG